MKPKNNFISNSANGIALALSSWAAGLLITNPIQDLLISDSCTVAQQTGLPLSWWCENYITLYANTIGAIFFVLLLWGIYGFKKVKFFRGILYGLTYFLVLSLYTWLRLEYINGLELTESREIRIATYLITIPHLAVGIFMGWLINLTANSPIDKLANKLSSKARKKPVEIAKE